MTLEARCDALVKLGNYLLDKESKQVLSNVYAKAVSANSWFTPKFCEEAFKEIALNFLNEKTLLDWVSRYPAIKNHTSQNVAIIMAGNIPAVGFHDVLCSFISGNKSLIKYSDKDNVLIPFLLEKIIEFYPDAAAAFQIIDKFQGADKVIATGSDNSSRYFEYYFSKYNHIIRSNRNAVAVLHGTENEHDILKLGDDIFRYFGLGCRSVSKIFLPRNFEIEFLMENLDSYSDMLLENSKYKNNFDYNRSIYLLNGAKHWCNDSVILLENNSLQSRIATLHVEFYDDLTKVVENINLNSEKIQCVVSKEAISGLVTLELGNSQNPGPGDYPDGVDTLKFLLN